MSFRIKMLLVSVVFFVVGHFFISPYFTISGLTEALKKNESEEFVKYVDFFSLRESLKKEISLKILKNKQKTWLADFVRRTLQTDSDVKILDEAINLVLTPQGVSRIMRGEGISLRGRSIGRWAERAPRRALVQRKIISDFFKGDFVLNRISFGEFYVIFLKAQKIRFSFRRSGFGWSLSAVTL